MTRLLVFLLLTFALAGCGGIPESRQKPQKAAPTYASSASARTCLSDLGKTNANFTPVPEQYFGGGCSMLNTVRLSALRGDYGDLGIINLGPVTCPLANTFAAWARFGVDRAARQILGSGLSRIETMGSYSCRNVAGTGRRSAHASAAAIDVSAFILADGRRVSVISGWHTGTDSEKQFLRMVHQSACKRFGTVLGPAYNAAHRDHLHLEATGGSFCR